MNDSRSIKVQFLLTYSSIKDYVGEQLCVVIRCDLYYQLLNRIPST